MKILFTGAGNLKNNGIYAMVISTYHQIQKHQPDCEFYLLSRNTVEDGQVLQNRAIKIVDEYWFKLKRNKLRLFTNFFYNLIILFISRYHKRIKIRNKTLKAYQECDLIIDLSGDSISTDYGNHALVLALYSIFLGLVSGKKVILYCQTIGPLNNGFLMRLTRLILNRVHEIILREHRSFDYLQRINITNKRIMVSTDCAFLLEPVFNNLETIIKENNLEFIKESKVIGFSPSSLIYKWFKDSVGDREMEAIYIEKIARMFDEISKKYNYKILFIPHVTLEWTNDRDICVGIYNSMNNKDRVIILQKDYKADELKALMMFCHIYIAFRMHAAIGATSMGIPTICFSYNDKFEGVIGENLGLMEFIINVREYTLTESISFLIQKIDHVLQNHDHIKQLIARNVSFAERQARENVFNILQVV